MNASNSVLGMRALAILSLTLTMLGAKAQGVSVPPGAQPGWLVSVRKAGRDLDRPEGATLTTFATPAGGFDLGSYRGTVPDAFGFGLSYDAEATLNIGEAGHHRLGVTASWDAGEPGSAEAHCAVALAIDDAKPTDWKGPIGPEAGQQALADDADLTPGPHKATLHAACDQPLGARFRVDVALKGPSDSDLRPPGLAEIVHGGQGAIAAAAAPMPAPPPISAAPSAPSALSGHEPAAGQLLVATTDLRIRAEPSAGARSIGRLVAGQQVEVAGPADDPAWYRLAQGGYASAAFLRPAGAAGPPRPMTVNRRAVPSGKYKVGDCAPYKMAVDVGGGRRETIEGVACLQPDGRWRIVR